MNFTSISDLQIQGFQGFLTISHLQQTACGSVPALPGIYVVVWPQGMPPTFLTSSTGGHFKGRNPSVAIAELESRWINKSVVLYIGKAGIASGEATLQTRLLTFMRFGKGEAVAHWGGRYIWQLTDSGSLQIGWKTTSGGIAEQLEKRLIRDFTAKYDRRPFANLRR